jgi:hybrid cluster-associated redox disulfide protein
MEEINAASLVADLMKKHPETRQVMSRLGLLCASCQGVQTETLRHAAQNHGVPLAELIAELKAAIKSGP